MALSTGLCRRKRFLLVPLEIMGFREAQLLSKDKLGGFEEVG